MLTEYSTLIILVLIIIFYVSYKIFSNPVPKSLKRIPGPIAWPLVGNMFSFSEPLWSYLFNLSKIYGPLFSFRLGHRDIVVFSSYKVMTKSFKDQGNNFSGRWQNILVKTLNHDSGIIFKDKEWWAEQRGFVLKVLRDFGFGKPRSQEIIDNECSILMKEIEETCGQVITTRNLFPKSTVNVISKLVMNMRFERDSKDFVSLTRVIENLLQKRNWLLTLLLMYPILENFPKFSKFLLWCIGRIQKSELQYKFIKGIIDEHKKRFNIENDPEDLIDEFLKQQHVQNENNIKNHTFTDWQLIRVGIELFIAGYETTSTTLTWSMLLLAKNPEIQDKVHQEILDVIGSGRTPNLGDKKSLNYTQAVLDEILRVSTVVPLSIPHRVFENTEINGYFIPKNSIIFPNLYACHRDKNVWERPFEFYPEHFLQTEDDGKVKYAPREELIPFSIGKRQCLGESLARMEFFVFFTSILQRFKIKLNEDMSEEEFSKVIGGTDGGIRAPLRSDVVFELRL